MNWISGRNSRDKKDSVNMQRENTRDKITRRLMQSIILTIMLAGDVFVYSGHSQAVWAKQTPGASQLRQVSHDRGFLDRQKVIAAAKQVTQKVYPNADEVQVDDFILARYEPDGTAKEWDDAYIKVLTEKGKRNNQSLSYSFSLPYSMVKVTLLEIIKPDGKIIPIDIASQSKVMVDRSQMGSNIYNPNNKQLRVGVPGLEVGDMVHIVNIRSTVKPRLPNTWTDYQIFEYQNPIKHTVYEIEAPIKLLPQKIALKSRVKGTVTSSMFERGGRKVYRWEIKNVPQIYEEPAMPKFYTVVQRLLVSTIPDWQYVSKWYWNLSKPHLEKTTPEMIATVKELTKGLADRRAKIRAIFRWVSQEIRYMGITIEKNAPGYEPHDVDMTFKDRHGVCRDKAALLVKMLRLAGFDAFPVLIDAGPKKDTEVPVPYFNHAISCVRNPDGSYILMDSTNESTRDLFPAYLSDKSFLVACPKGETLKTSPIIPPEKNLMLVSTKAKIDARGNLTARTELKFNGINDTVYRGYFASLKKDKQQQYFEGLVKRVVPGARLISYQLEPQNILDTTRPVKAKFSFSAKNVLIGNANTNTNNNANNNANAGVKMLPQLWVGTKVGMVNFILRQTGLKKRCFPLVTDFACGVRETLDLQLDDSTQGVVQDTNHSDSIGKVILPGFTDINDSVITWQRKMENKGSGITGQNDFLIKVVEFTPKQYLQMKKDLKDIEYNGRKMAIIKTFGQSQRAFAKADKVVLDSQVEYRLKDARNWTEIHHVKELILTYKGKKDNAELKVNYNPVWEKVKLIKAVVTTGSKVQQISKLEQNLMDAGWVAAAPRYPAAKTLVASLPGVEAGSVIEYEYEKVCTGHPFFSTTQVFRTFDPMKHKKVRLVAPAGANMLNIQVYTNDNGIGVEDSTANSTGSSAKGEVIKYHTQLRDGNVIYEWDVYNQPALKQEDNLPPLYSFNPVLRVSVVTPSDNLAGYAKKVHNVLANAAASQPQTYAKALELTNNISGTKAKIKAIRNFVAQNIRLAGPGLAQLPLNAVSPADTTLADGYGNMTDRAVLLYSMLKAVFANTKPEIEYVLASRISRIPRLETFRKHYPDSGMFMVVLVRAGLPEGDIYLNDTDQYAVLGSTASDGYLGYFTAQKRIDKITSLKGKHNYIAYSYNVKLQKNGDATIDIIREYSGNYFASRRKMFAEMPPEQRRRYYQQLVSSVSQSASPVTPLVTSYNNYPGKETFTLQVKRYAVRDGDYMYFELPQTLYDLFGLRSDKHMNPFYDGTFTHFLINTTISLPDEFSDVVLAPEVLNSSLLADAGNIKITSKHNGNKLTYTHEVSLKPFIIAPADYDDLMQLNSQLSNAQSSEILLKK